MCQALGKLEIANMEENGYVRGWVGRTGFYIPPKAHQIIRSKALALIHQQVEAEMVKGMLVRIERR